MKKDSTTIRLEMRHYLSQLWAGLSWNPAATVAWSGPTSGLFASSTGVWQIEVPIWVSLLGSPAKSSSDAGKAKKPQEKSDKVGPLVIGASYVHVQTFGMSTNQVSNGVSVFLGGAFDSQLVK